MSEQPEFTIEYLDPATLSPAPFNFRQHPATQRAALESSIEEYGWLAAPIVNRNGSRILDGHARVEIALQRGETAIPVRVVDVSEADEKRILAAFDRVGELREVDDAALVLLLSELAESEAGLPAGWNDADLAALIGSLEEANSGLLPDADPDAIPEQVETRTKPGDLWLLGDKHKLLVGDCTVAANVERLLGDEKASLIFTDPPYNVASESRNYAQDAPTQQKTYKALADADWDKEFEVEPALATLLTAMADDCAVYICTSHFLVQRIWDWAAAWAKFHHYIVWCKPNPAPCLSKRHWTWATELVVYAVRGKHTCNFPDSGHALNWWEIVSPTHLTEHPTEKPVAVPLRAIQFSSKPGDVVFDGFAGSGTTLIACEQTGRVARCMEIEPRYADIILARFEQVSGKKATLAVRSA